MSLAQNVALGGFTSLSCGGRQKNVLKGAMHVQSCCVAHKPNCFFLRCRCRCRRRRRVVVVA